MLMLLYKVLLHEITICSWSTASAAKDNEPISCEALNSHKRVRQFLVPLLMAYPITGESMPFTVTQCSTSERRRFCVVLRDCLIMTK
jgi:hypothetical protein